MMHKDYFEAGFKVFGLHGTTRGACDCGNENCTAFFKHPKTSNWQQTPEWSKEQFVVMGMNNQFDTGFGVLCQGYLIIDIDPRNGGDEGYDQLVKDTGINFKDEAGFVVATGGGGWHIYYKHSGAVLHSHLKAYKGIDFKSSGFVVGAGSIHKSGGRYEVEEGFVDEITELPAELFKLLEKIQREFKPSTTSTNNEIVEYLPFIKCFEDYEDWITVGMAIHNALNGEGFDLWDKWSRQSDKYAPELMEHKWHSFGKSSNPVTVATLAKMAMDNGYIQPVTFEVTEPLAQVSDEIDLNKAPGLVGECINYINGCSRFPRESLAVSAALMAVANIGGMRFEDEAWGATPNLFCFNVAGSATGKEAIQQAQSDLMLETGMGACCYGTIKSEQEIYRNIVRHQTTLYQIDEFGILLNKVEQASKGGSASYMGGVIGALMSIYSKANKNLVLGADFAESLIAELSKEIAAINKLIDSNEAKDFHLAKQDSLMALMVQLKNGHIASPFLSLAGYTTPSTFNDLVSYQQATSGFIGRALIFEEKNNNPKAKHRFLKAKLPEPLKLKLKALRYGGAFKNDFNERIEHNGAMTLISTEDEAMALLDTISEDLYNQAQNAMETNGLEAIARRSFELVLKVSMILAMGDVGIRTTEHVKWAYALVQKDLNNKINLTCANMAEHEEDLSKEVLNKVRHKLDKNDGITLGALANKLRKIDKTNIEEALNFLLENGEIIAKTTETAKKRKIVNYFHLNS